MNTEEESWVSQENLIDRTGIRRLKEDESVDIIINYNIEVISKHKCRIKEERITFGNPDEYECLEDKIDIYGMVSWFLQGHYKNPNVEYGYFYEGPEIIGDIVEKLLKNLNSRNKMEKEIEKLSDVSKKLVNLVGK